MSIEKGLSLVQLAFEPGMTTHFSGAGATAICTPNRF